MDALVTTAFVGTARQVSNAMTTGTPVDTLLAKHWGNKLERGLLLAAGAWAVYRQAGQVTEHLPTVREPAAPETLRTCSLQVAKLLESMFAGEHKELLPEALERMRQASLRLPPSLLPAALDMQSTEIRARLIAVLGERGRWLSRFNPAWSWVVDTLPAGEDTLPADAETTWQEGTTGQRRELLRRLRNVNPAQAREWLAAVWKQEKADVRAELLKTFEVGLAAEDEEFLEKALDDRAASVRAVAPPLLARIPVSAFTERMRSRADALLIPAAKKFKVTLAETLAKDWQRDGIEAKPPQGVGEQAWWMMQVLAYVHPAHWEERSGLSPEQLVAACPKDWKVAMLEGWSRAALLHQSTSWMMSLWPWWCSPKASAASSSFSLTEIREGFGKYIPQALLEARVLGLESGSEAWSEALAELPMPWSLDFGGKYLQQLRQHLHSLDFKRRNYNSYYDNWYHTLNRAALALPPACFAATLEPPLLIKQNEENNTNWQVGYWQEALNTFTEALRIRQRLIEEIA